MRCLKGSCRFFLPHDADRACESKAVARVAGTLARRTSVKKKLLKLAINSKTLPYPALRHWVGKAGRELEEVFKQYDHASDHHSSRGAQEHQPARGTSLEIN